AAAKPEEPAEPSAEGELEKKLSAALEGLKELESVKKANAAYEERIKALEKRPTPSTVPGNEREMEQLE
ncbi:MAG TPA: hypothetical protein DD420_13110, partial [Streptomyces sp.]|nr:hypothetical protein [Streptomyces sp.]